MTRTPPPLHPACAVPQFAPVRAGRGRFQFRRTLHGRRRALAAGLAVAAAALAAAPARGGADGDTTRDVSRESTHPAPTPDGKEPRQVAVSAPVRIPDKETVRLLRPGDRIDVIASGSRSGSVPDSAHFVARNVRVAQLPQSDDTVAGDGALIVLTVSRSTATRLAGAAANSRLAVTLC